MISAFVRWINCRHKIKTFSKDMILMTELCIRRKIIIIDEFKMRKGFINFVHSYSITDSGNYKFLTVNI